MAEARLTNPSDQSSSTDRTVELEFWNFVKDTEVLANFEAYLEKYPEGNSGAWPRFGWQIFRTHPGRASRRYRDTTNSSTVFPLEKHHERKSEQRQTQKIGSHSQG